VLTALAMAVAISLPVILLSVGNGVSEHELRDLESSGYQIAISAPGLHGIIGAHDLVKELDRTDAVSTASPVLSVAVDLFHAGRGPIPVLAEGVIPQAFTATLSPEELGLFPTPLPLGDPADLAHWANGSYAGPSADRILLSSPLAAANGLSVGESLNLSASAAPEPSTSFTIAGTFGVPPALLGPTGAFAALLPLSDLQLLTGYARNPSGSLIDAADTVQVALAGSAATQTGRVNQVAGVIQGMYPYYAVSTLTETVEQAASAAAILSGFYLALSSVSLAVGLLFLALVLLRRVESMGPSIAIRRAIGVPARLLAWDQAREALWLSGVGLVGGLLLGVGAVEALATWGHGAVQEAAQLAIFDPTMLTLLGLSVLGLGLLASTAATRAALRLPVTEVLR
jgi:hypothetical protein